MSLWITAPLLYESCFANITKNWFLLKWLVFWKIYWCNFNEKTMKTRISILKIILHKVQIRMESFTFSSNFQIQKKNFETVILSRIFFPESSRSVKLPKKFLENIMVTFLQNFHFCKICLKWAQNGSKMTKITENWNSKPKNWEWPSGMG